MIRLSDYIAEAGGWLSLERFMEIALYHPEYGYYSASIQNVGVRGDFSTTATLSPLLGRAIVGEWKKACERVGAKLPMIEVGGGNASLALAVQEALGFWKRLSTRYHIVETSPQLRDLQHLALGNRADIHTDMKHALKACKGRAFIFSNELVDAFPARVFEQTEEGWEEVGLAVRDGKLVEEGRAVESLPTSVSFDYRGDIGQRIEVHESYARWFGSWLSSWKSGVMTTIDYGAEVECLYDRKPKGTLRGYRQHAMLQGMDVYQQVGKCDITCDVNFSDLIQVVSRCLGDKVELLSQRDYLLPYLDGGKRGGDRVREEYLIAEHGPGDHFKVLVQTRLSLGM